MRITRVLSAYVGRIFLSSTLAVLAGLLAVVALFDIIELMRRASGRQEVAFGDLATITALKLPFLAMEILPFAVLLGGLVAFWRLTRSSELIVARAAGVSAWQFLAVPVLAAVALGAFATTALSPVSATMLARADRLDAALLRGGAGALGLAGGGIWVRQPDPSIPGGGWAVLRGQRVELAGTTLRLTNVSVFRLERDDRFHSRLEAAEARLEPGRWVLRNAASVAVERPREPLPEVAIPTDLTVQRLQESLAPPDTLSFWALPRFIAVLEQAGFSSLKHRLRYQALLALPLLAGVMVLVAAGFSMRPSRRGGVGLAIAAGVGAGVALFVLTKVVGEFGGSGAIPVTLAAWTPSAVGLALAVAMLLHLEDG
jgi:lipopolysaccharide export system permease protein